MFATILLTSVTIFKILSGLFVLAALLVIPVVSMKNVSTYRTDEKLDNARPGHCW